MLCILLGDQIHGINGINAQQQRTAAMQQQHRHLPSQYNKEIGRRTKKQCFKKNTQHIAKDPKNSR